MKHIMIATDGSESADEALDFAIEIARDAGATLHVLSVRPPQVRRTTRGVCEPSRSSVGLSASPIRLRRPRRRRRRGGGRIAHGDVVTSIVDAAEP